MDGILRGAAVYFFLMLILRVAGKRALSEMTVFDFIVLLIVSETTQQALLLDDYSMTNCFALIATLLGLDIGLSLLKRYWGFAERVLEGVPLLLVDNGRVIAEHLRKARVDEDDIVSAARKMQGLERIDQVKFAVLERSGGITIVPKAER